MALNTVHAHLDSTKNFTDVAKGFADIAKCVKVEQIADLQKRLGYLAKTGRPIAETLQAVHELNKVTATLGTIGTVMGVAGFALSLVTGIMSMFLGDPKHEQIMNSLNHITDEVAKINRKLDELPVRIKELISMGHTEHWCLMARAAVRDGTEYAAHAGGDKQMQQKCYKLFHDNKFPSLLTELATIICKDTLRSGIVAEGQGQTQAVQQLLAPFLNLAGELLGLALLYDSTYGLTQVPDHQIAADRLKLHTPKINEIKEAVELIVSDTMPIHLHRKKVEFVAASHKEKKKLSCMLDGNDVDLFPGSGYHQTFFLEGLGGGDGGRFYVRVLFKGQQERFLSIAAGAGSDVIDLWKAKGCNQEFEIRMANGGRYHNGKHVYYVKSTAPTKGGPDAKRFMSYHPAGGHVDLWHAEGVNQWWHIVELGQW